MWGSVGVCDVGLAGCDHLVSDLCKEVVRGVRYELVGVSDVAITYEIISVMICIGSVKLVNSY